MLVGASQHPLNLKNVREADPTGLLRRKRLEELPRQPQLVRLIPNEEPYEDVRINPDQAASTRWVARRGGLVASSSSATDFATASSICSIVTGGPE